MLPVQRFSRRTLLAGVGATAALSACSTPTSGSADAESGVATAGGGAVSPLVGLRMPDEGEKHTATWMAFAASPEIWGRDLSEPVLESLALISATIVDFEPVRILVPSRFRSQAGRLLDKRVEIIYHEADDLWMRDTGPTFVQSAQAPGLRGIDFNFNGWGGKQAHDLDAKVAAAVCAAASVPRERTELVIEGGALEVDGAGTAIITRSCVLNDNRNPGWTQEQVEAELAKLLGLRKIIWLPGIAGRDITDGHTDFYARFAGPGVVVAGRDDDPESFDYEVTRTHLEILNEATDADGKPLRIEVLPAPVDIREEYAGDDFAAGYINFYVCNGAVIAPQFGDAKADGRARELLTELFPGREVVQLDIDPIAAGGGGIHCTTQQQPEPA